MPTTPPDPVPTCESAITAYIRLARSFRFRERSFALAVEIAAEAFHHDCLPQPEDEREAIKLFKHRLLTVSLPLVDRLIDPSTRLPLWNLLGVRCEEDLWLCSAAGLYLNPKDALLGEAAYPQAWRPTRRVEVGDRQKLFLAMRLILSRSPDFMAMFPAAPQLAPQPYDPLQPPPDPTASPETRVFLDRRGAIAAMSHYAREILFLTLIRLATRRQIQCDEATLNAAFTGSLKAQAESESCDKLARGIVFPTVSDLRWVSRKQHWAVFVQADDEPDAPDWLEGEAVFQEYARLTREDGDEEGHDNEDSDLAATTEQTVSQRRSAREQPDTLSPEQLDDYLSDLIAVQTYIEGSSIQISCHPQSESFPCISRFRAATQFLSYFIERPFRVIDREELIELIKRLFDGVGEVDQTILKGADVYASCIGGDRWGRSYSDNLEDLVRAVMNAPKKPARRHVLVLLTRFVKEHLEALARKNCPIAITQEETLEDVLVRFKDKPGSCAVELWLSAIRLRAEALNDSNRARRQGTLSEIESLLSNLEEIMVLYRAQAIEVLSQWLSDQLDCSPSTTAPFEATDEHSEKGEEEGSSKGKSRKTLQQTLGDCFRVRIDQRNIKSRNELNSNDRLWLAGFNFLVERLLPEPIKDDQETRVQKIKGFFTQIYAPGQGSGVRTWSREEWEYLAYQVAIAVPPYEVIRRRLQERLPDRWNQGLADLYDRLSNDDVIPERLQSAVNDCCSLGRQEQ